MRRPVRRRIRTNPGKRELESQTSNRVVQEVTETKVKDTKPVGTVRTYAPDRSSTTSGGVNLKEALPRDIVRGRVLISDNPLDIAESVGVNGKEFRIQNTMIHLTYSGHLNFEKWLKFAKDPKPAGLGAQIKEYSMVHETGSEGYEHTHILVKFAKPLNSRNARIVDFEGIHPHVRRVSRLEHWNNVLEYHTKQGEPYTMLVTEPIISRVWKHNNVSDAILQMCETTNEVGGIIAAFNHKPVNYGPKPKVNWRPWQTKLIEEFKEQPDTRTVNWIWDPYGSGGKTFMARHLGMFEDYFVSDCSDPYHVATILEGYLNEGRTAFTVIFNFTRQSEKKKIYQAIESFKDGMITSRKYRGRTIYFPHPHVTIFANYAPDISKMTLDRWRIRTITGGTDFKHDWTGFMVEKWIREHIRNGSSRKEAMEYFEEQTILDLDPPPGFDPDKTIYGLF